VYIVILPYEFISFYFEMSYEAIITLQQFNKFSTALKRSAGIFWL